jgi:hypothetical protein
MEENGGLYSSQFRGVENNHSIISGCFSPALGQASGEVLRFARRLHSALPEFLAGPRAAWVP